MDVLEGHSNDNGPTAIKEHVLRRRKKIKKKDISLPKDFIHVATVKYKKKVQVNFSDPVLQNFLQQAEVDENELSNPEILHVVTNFIERVGVDAIHKELESSKLSFIQPDSEVLVAECENISAASSEDHSSLKSADENSLIFSPDHDIEITSDMDEVFTTQTDARLSVNDSENSEADNIDSPKPRTSDASEGESKIDHASFLCELQAAIRKREIRMRLKRQAEQKRGEDIWSDFKPTLRSKRRVSFFEPEKSPSPKPMRTVHTRWDLTDDSSVIDDLAGKIDESGVERTNLSIVQDVADETSRFDECDASGLAKPKLPLSKGTKAFNKGFSVDDTSGLRIPLQENEAASETNGVQSISDSDHHQENSGATKTQPKQMDGNTSQEVESFAPEMGSEKVEDSPTIMEAMNGSKGEAPDKKRQRKRNHLKKEESHSGYLEKEESEVNAEVKASDNIGTGSHKRIEKKKGKNIKGNKHKDSAGEEFKMEDEPVELRSVGPQDIRNTETLAKIECKNDISIFSSLIRKKKISAEMPAKEEIPKISTDVTAKEEMPGDNGEGNKDDSKNLSAPSPELNPHSNKKREETRKRIAVKKTDICMVTPLMRDLRHVTHITWDPERHNFIINHTDDDELRKLLLQEKLCIEIPKRKQRRNSYSMAVDCIEFDFEKRPIKPEERRSFSLSTASRVFSRGDKKRAPLPRPKSDLPMHDHVIYF